MNVLSNLLLLLFFSLLLPINAMKRQREESSEAAGKIVKLTWTGAAENLYYVLPISAARYSKVISQMIRDFDPEHSIRVRSVSQFILESVVNFLQKIDNSQHPNLSDDISALEPHNLLEITLAAHHLEIDELLKYCVSRWTALINTAQRSDALLNGDNTNKITLLFKYLPTNIARQCVQSDSPLLATKFISPQIHNINSSEIILWGNNITTYKFSLDSTLFVAKDTENHFYFINLITKERLAWYLQAFLDKGRMKIGDIYIEVNDLNSVTFYNVSGDSCPERILLHCGDKQSVSLDGKIEVTQPNSNYIRLKIC